MWVAIYILNILLVNWLFVVLPIFQTPWGGWSVANLVVGLVFVVRDFAQRQWGHWVLLATAFGGLLTWWVVGIVTPEDSFITAGTLALASVTAFMVSETVDWIVYTLTKRPLSERILFSATFSAPIDTAVFLSMIGFLTPASFALESLSKTLAAVVIWGILRYRMARLAASS